MGLQAVSRQITASILKSFTNAVFGFCKNQCLGYIHTILGSCAIAVQKRKARLPGTSSAFTHIEHREGAVGREGLVN